MPMTEANITINMQDHTHSTFIQKCQNVWYFINFDAILTQETQRLKQERQLEALSMTWHPLRKRTN
jgi:hypothetical protein